MSAPFCKSFSSPLHNVQPKALAVRPVSMAVHWVSRGTLGIPEGGQINFRCAVCWGAVVVPFLEEAPLGLAWWPWRLLMCSHGPECTRLPAFVYVCVCFSVRLLFSLLVAVQRRNQSVEVLRFVLPLLSMYIQKPTKTLCPPPTTFK